MQKLNNKTILILLVLVGVVLVTAFSSGRPSNHVDEIAVGAPKKVVDNKIATFDDDVRAGRLSPAEKLALKQEFLIEKVQKFLPYTYDQGGYTIEVSELGTTTNGIYVYVRAWDVNGQVGFGTDGTVEYERIRIANPPIMIPDPTGNIVVPSEEILDIEGNPTGQFTSERRYTTNPAEALKADLTETIGIIAKPGNNIIPGKRGNTVSTFYSEAGGDGDITSGGGVSFATARSGHNLGVDKVDNDGNIYVDTSYYIRRHYFPFDTSSIPSGDTVSSSTLRVTHPNAAQVNTDNLSYGVTGSDQASLTTLETTDWGITSDTRYADSDKSNATFAGANTNYYYDMNSTGLSNIAKGSGFTALSIRTNKDIDNTSTGITGGNYIDLYFANETTGGNTYDPKLIVEHAAAASPTANKQDVIWFE